MVFAVIVVPVFGAGRLVAHRELNVARKGFVWPKGECNPGDPVFLVVIDRAVEVGGQGTPLPFFPAPHDIHPLDERQVLDQQEKRQLLPDVGGLSGDQVLRVE